MNSAKIKLIAEDGELFGDYLWEKSFFEDVTPLEFLIEMGYDAKERKYVKTSSDFDMGEVFFQQGDKDWDIANVGIFEGDKLIYTPYFRYPDTNGFKVDIDYDTVWKLANIKKLPYIGRCQDNAVRNYHGYEFGFHSPGSTNIMLKKEGGKWYEFTNGMNVCIEEERGT